MVDSSVAEPRLELYKQLDINAKEERRLQVLALWDYYSEVICEVATTYLGLSKDLKDKNLQQQWTRSRNRLIQLSSFSSEGDYEKAIGELHEIRNATFHDYENWPPIDPIQTIRGEAEDFREWLISYGEIYDRKVNELDARETMIRIAERNIEGVLHIEVPFEEPFKSTVTDKRDEAKELQRELNSIKDGDEISMKLLNILVDSMQYQEDSCQAREYANHVGYVLSEVAEPEVSPKQFDL
ncbi:hypothetical protein [Halococcus sp. AFM35]|uniref:hypothetical protein n=1 Tax=Halococcus sp. AFM35 TaxID=3421653 RepID=UPI003EBEDAD1